MDAPPAATGLSYGKYCAELMAQTDLLRSHIRGADLTAPVPSCPEWNLGQLLRHLGGGQRWAAEIVRSRATQPPADNSFRELADYTNEDPDVLDPWLAEGAKLLADALREAGPGARVWTPIPGGEPSTGFWARRFAHETVVHRADAALAVDETFHVDADIAVDAIDEWMELGCLPMHFEVHPWMRELLGPARTLHFHATDTGQELAAEWVVDLTGETIAWRRAHEKATVAVRAPLTDLLLIIYRRRGPAGENIEILGDAALLDFWLDRVAFG